jgi:hypothetical protein
MCLQAAFQRSCNVVKSGGSNFLYLANRTDVDDITIGVNGEVTGILMVGLGVFYKYEFAPNQSSYAEPSTNEGGFQATQTYNMVWESWDQTQWNAMMDMVACNCGMVVIHGENTGKVLIWGFDETEEAYFFSSDRNSGTAKSDTNQTPIVLQALATKPAREFTPGLAGIPV